MKKRIQSRKGMLFCAVLMTAICLMYVASILRNGFWEALRYPSLAVNGALFGCFAAMAVICWYRGLFFKPGQQEFCKKKHSPAVCRGLAAFCGIFAAACMVLYFCFERSRILIGAAALLLACAVVWAGRAGKAVQEKDGAPKK